MTNLIRELGKEGVLVGYNNDSPTYRLYDNTNGRIVSSRNVKFIERVDSNTPSMVDDIGEGSKSYYMMGYKTWNQPPWIM